MFHKYILILQIVVLVVTVSIFAQTRTEDKPQKGQLIVIIKGIRNEQAGKLILNLYQGEENWLESGREFSKKILKVSKDDEMQTIFTDIPYYQSFAIQVFHDRNNNGKLDFQWFPPKPEEGVGVSNNQFRKGPPDYNEAKIYLKKKVTITQINMHY